MPAKAAMSPQDSSVKFCGKRALFLCTLSRSAYSCRSSICDVNRIVQIWRPKVYSQSSPSKRRKIQPSTTNESLDVNEHATTQQSNPLRQNTSKKPFSMRIDIPTNSPSKARVPLSQLTKNEFGRFHFLLLSFEDDRHYSVNHDFVGYVESVVAGDLQLPIMLKMTSGPKERMNINRTVRIRT